MQHFSLPKHISQQNHVYPMDIISHVAAAPGPLAFPSHSARPPKCLNKPKPCPQRSAPYPSRSARPRKCLNLT